MFVSTSDPRSTTGFSGTLHSIYMALLPRFAVLSPVFIQRVWRLCNKLDGAHRRITGRDGKFLFSRMFSLLSGRLIESKIRRLRPDVIICIAASSVIARLRTDVPIIYCTDATFTAMTRLYPAWKELPDWSRRDGDDAEQFALEKAAAVVMSSAWAKDSAVQDYGTPAGKITILPYGPNIRRDLLPKAETPIPSDPKEELQLVYVGLDWKRKGGDFALKVTKLLNARGVPARLNVVGRAPEEALQDPSVTYHGFLNKDVPEQAERIARIYLHAHMLLLPTIADATPVVFSEAAAFSLPSITFDTGGVASAVKDGQSGRVFPLGTSPEVVADFVAGLVADPSKLAALRATSFSWYVETANWNHWAETVHGLAAQHCGRHVLEHAERRDRPAFNLS